MSEAFPIGYKWPDAELNESHEYLLPVVSETLKQEAVRQRGSLKPKIFDLGFGNGSVANYVSQLGWDVTGIDPSLEGVTQASKRYPDLKLFQGSAYDDLLGTYGTFPVVISLEVVEHVYFPRLYAKSLYSILQPDGVAIISTPYHSYVKNLAIAITGKMDSHFTALWDHGHIKFWSIKTLTHLLREVGFTDIQVHRVGRIPSLAKSMIFVCRK